MGETTSAVKVLFSQRLWVSSVRVFAVLLYQRLGYRNRTPEELNGPTELTEIAGKSGGEILTAAEWHGKSVALGANVEAKVKSEETLYRCRFKRSMQHHLV